MKDIKQAMNSLKPSRPLKRDFTQDAMTVISAPRARIKALGIIFTRFSAMPRYAAILTGVASAVLLGGAAYAAYVWIVPEVKVTNIQQSNDDNKKQYTIDSQCGDFYSGKDLKYEIPQNSGLTDQDVRKVFQNTCAYDALSKFIDSKWISDNTQKDMAKKKVGDIVTIYQHSNAFAGSVDTNPIFGLTIGKVTEIDQKKLTIALPVYSIKKLSFSGDPAEHFPQGKTVTRTLDLSPNVEVWESGQPKKLQDVKVGDEIQVVVETQNLVQYYEDIHQKSLGKQIKFDIAGIVKTDIDTKYVSGDVGTFAQIGDPAIVNAIASLKPCTSNEEYLCTFAPNEVDGTIYAVGTDLKDENLKYQRKDYADKNIKYYEIDGRIKTIDGSKLTLETRGKKTTFTVTFPYDVIAAYNRNPAPIVTEFGQSPGIRVEVGDMVQVLYAQKPSENPQEVKPGDIGVFSALRQSLPGGTVVKY